MTSLISLLLVTNSRPSVIRNNSGVKIHSPEQQRGLDDSVQQQRRKKHIGHNARSHRSEFQKEESSEERTNTFNKIDIADSRNTPVSTNKDQHRSRTRIRGGDNATKNNNENDHNTSNKINQRSSRAETTKIRHLQQNLPDLKSLTTTFKGGAAQSGCMFDLVTTTRPITILEIDIHTTSRIEEQFEVWTKDGSLIGHETNPISWYMVGCGTVTGVGYFAATPLPSEHIDYIRIEAASRKAIYTSLVYPGAYMQYSEPQEGDYFVTGDVYAQNEDVRLLVGVGKTHYFGAGTYYDRLWNGNLRYTIGIKDRDIPVDGLNCRPSMVPSLAPTSSPSLSQLPSVAPSKLPSLSPSNFPTLVPSAIPSDVPSSIPSDVPSDMPSDLPSDLPSDVPTVFPTLKPSVVPTIARSIGPTLSPTKVPTSLPSDIPSDIPSQLPSALPSHVPSDVPSFIPSDVPSDLPSDIPSDIPSTIPSDVPTDVPSLLPSEAPSINGTHVPTLYPTDVPTLTPTTTPTTMPSTTPTGTPSLIPTVMPTTAPTTFPTSHPTAMPSTTPSDRPSQSESGSSVNFSALAAVAAAAGM